MQNQVTQYGEYIMSTIITNNNMDTQCEEVITVDKDKTGDYIVT